MRKTYANQHSHNPPPQNGTALPVNRAITTSTNIVLLNGLAPDVYQFYVCECVVCTVHWKAQGETIPLATHYKSPQPVTTTGTQVVRTLAAYARLTLHQT